MTLGVFALLCMSCFLPWSYHADVDKYFTGFFSEKNIYGKPAKMLLSLGSITVVCAFIHLLWLKRLALLASGLTVAYAIKNFLLFGSCYLGYCPEKEIGLYLMLISSLLLFAMAFFPEGYDKKKQAE